MLQPIETNYKLYWYLIHLCILKANALRAEEKSPKVGKLLAQSKMFSQLILDKD